MNIKITKNIKEANCITHNGKFHCDEVFSTIIFLKILPEIVLYRTSDVTLATENQYVYDVGEGELDHHQLGGNGERENGVKYSSCGLVWRKFGKEVIKKYTTNEVNYIWELIDKNLIQCIDAGDNGQTPDINTDYTFVHISSIIGNFNPNWDEEIDSDENFLEALIVAEKIFDNTIKNTIAKVKAKKFVDKAIEESNDGIMILERFFPWKEFLLESQNEKAININFVVFPSNRGGFNIYTVPKSIHSFESRKLFPKEWAGLKDKELQEKCNIKTAKFCHNACFICVTETREDAIKLARIANSV